MSQHTSNDLNAAAQEEIERRRIHQAQHRYISSAEGKRIRKAAAAKQRADEKRNRPTREMLEAQKCELIQASIPIADFAKEFADWMVRNGVPTDSQLRGWEVGRDVLATATTSGISMHGMTTEGSTYATKVDIYFVTPGGKIRICRRAGSPFSYSTRTPVRAVSIASIQQRIIKAIADSNGKISWP